MYSLLLAAAAGAVLAAPQSVTPGTEDPGLPTAQGVHRIWVSKSCTNNEQLLISEAFYDAQKLAVALDSWVPGGTNQDVMDTYMGTKSSWSGDPIWPFGSNYKKIIKNNLDREASVYEPYSWTDNNLYIQCNKDTQHPDGTINCGSGTYAWTWNNPGYIWTDHYMTFCPLFFSSSSLSDDIAAAKSGQKNSKVLENFETNRAVTFFHESFHMMYTVSNPWIRDGPNSDTYGAEPAYELARDQNAGATYVTAENYALSGLAIYLRNTLGLSYIPLPQKYAGVASNDPVPAAPVRQALDTPAAGIYASDPNDPNGAPDPNQWQLLFGAPGSQSVSAVTLGQPAQCAGNPFQYPQSATLLLSDGSTQTSLTSLAFSLRQVLCNDQCALPAGISGDVARFTTVSDGCEISVAIPDSAEVYLYRATHSQGTQWQECWDYTQDIFNACLIRGPNAGDGWVNGEQEYQFYQGGVRKINDPGSYAVKAGNPLDPSKTLQFAPSSGHD